MNTIPVILPLNYRDSVVTIIIVQKLQIPSIQKYNRKAQVLMTKEKGVKWKAFTTAFPYTIPIFTGFWFLGLTYGIYMNVSGFSFWYPMLMSLTIFAGSIEFVTVNMLLGAFNPIQALTMTLMINARHLFYGISMLDQFKGARLEKNLSDLRACATRSFSINYTADIPKDVDRGWFMFFRHPAEPAVLGFRFDSLGGDLRLPDQIQHGRAGICHGRHVRRHFHGAVAERERTTPALSSGICSLRPVSDGFRLGRFYHSFHDRDSGSF